MRFVAPRCGLPEVTVAEGQLDYLTVTAAIQTGPPESLLLRVRLNADDRALAAAGHDLFISLLTFGGPMQPISVAMGRDGVPPVEVGA